MTKERPILFTAEMVNAILDGRKNQARRIVKFNESHRVKAVGSNKNWHIEDSNVVLACPHGQLGDRLWVRETWQHSNYPRGFRDDCLVFYRADYRNDPHGYDGEKSPEGKYRKWYPSIFMPRVASRITLEITGVSVERLQDISEEDAMAEGAEQYRLPVYPYREELRHVDGFRILWESINGSGSWDLNPFVWKICFKILEVGK